MRSAAILAMAATAAWTAGCASPYSRVREVRDTVALAATAEQRAVAKGVRARRGADALGLYLDAADDARRRLAADPFDTLARSDYNFAVARVVELASAGPGGGGGSFVARSPGSGRAWRLEAKRPVVGQSAGGRILAADRLVLRGQLVGDRAVSAGLGAPVAYAAHDAGRGRIVGIREASSVFYNLTAALEFSGDRCELVYIDPLEKETLALDGHTYPLLADHRAAFAIALEELRPRRAEVSAFFRPETFLESASLARLQPYDPEKTPVLFIHGLGNSPATWAPVLSFLRADPEIRRRYQFWYFWYPTGLPYPLSAAILRRQLDAFRRAYPGHKDIVVVGHSMGGMIARLLITDSGMTLWDTFLDRTPDEIPLSEATKPILVESLIFKARPDIARVLFISPSHRGSDLAVQTLGRIGARLIGNPLDSLRLNEELYSLFRPEARSRSRLPNSVDMLDPTNTFVQVVDSLPTKRGIPFHTLVGDRGRGGFLDRTRPVSNDGVVPYWSSHLRGAESERIIPSGHWSHLHPLGMAEIKRVLLLHQDRR